jgi:hypothetical protein
MNEEFTELTRTDTDLHRRARTCTDLHRQFDKLTAGGRGLAQTVRQAYHRWALTDTDGFDRLTTGLHGLMDAQPGAAVPRTDTNR